MGSRLLQRGEEYHALMRRSVTNFTVVRRQKGSQIFCNAKRREWPEAAVSATLCPELGEERKWLALPRNDVNDLGCVKTCAREEGAE
jgi:hypothetical protein